MPEVFPFKAYADGLIDPFEQFEFDPSLITDGSTATKAPSPDEYPLPIGWISDWFCWYEFATPPTGFELSFTARVRQDAFDAGVITEFDNDILVHAYTSTPLYYAEPVPKYVNHITFASTDWTTTTVTVPALEASTTWWFAFYSHRISAPGLGEFTSHDLAEVHLIADGLAIPTRLYPRDDALGNSPRIVPAPRSIQSGNRRSTYY